MKQILKNNGKVRVAIMPHWWRISTVSKIIFIGIVLTYHLIKTFIEHKFTDKNHLNVLIISTTPIAMIFLRVSRLNENYTINKWTTAPIITSLIFKIKYLRESLPFGNY